MKKIVSVTEVEGEGLESLMGKRVMLLCLNYIYSGVLQGVAADCVALSEPAIVYETGEWTEKSYADVQRLPCDVLYVQRTAIEAFGKGK